MPGWQNLESILDSEADVSHEVHLIGIGHFHPGDVEQDSEGFWIYGHRVLNGETKCGQCGQRVFNPDSWCMVSALSRIIRSHDIDETRRRCRSCDVSLQQIVQNYRWCRRVFERECSHCCAVHDVRDFDYCENCGFDLGDSIPTSRRYAMPHGTNAVMTIDGRDFPIEDVNIETDVVGPVVATTQLELNSSDISGRLRQVVKIYGHSFENGSRICSQCGQSASTIKREEECGNVAVEQPSVERRNRREEAAETHNFSDEDFVCYDCGKSLQEIWQTGEHCTGQIDETEQTALDSHDFTGLDHICCACGKSLDEIAETREYCSRVRMQSQEISGSVIGLAHFGGKKHEPEDPPRRRVRLREEESEGHQ